jgi:beta-phosphoglucomutase-like phosphatase (HAD superfamily)
MIYKCFIYDFDGVICDSVNIKTEAFLEIYSQESEENKMNIKDYHLANGGISRFEKIQYFENYILKKEISPSDLISKGEMFSLLVKQKVIESNYIPGIIDFLNLNFEKKLQFICTGTPENEITDIVNMRRINKYFNKVYGSPKSKVEIIKKILIEYKLLESECLFFGDAITDLNAANQMNIDFLGLENSDTLFPDKTITIENFFDKKLQTII